MEIDFGLEMLRGNYFYKDEKTAEELYVRVAKAGGSNERHTKRLFKYMAKHWWSPATPILSNLGTDRGAPISCFTNEVEDSKDGIRKKYDENFVLGSMGGGVGTDWSHVREIGAKVGANGQSSGIIPFMKVSDSSTLAVSQGGLRRASQAVYLDVSHPEIEEFIEIRKATGREANRLCTNLNHGVKISDAFMQAVLNDEQWDLVSPHTKKVVKSVSAFDLWRRILITRVEKGEPYLMFVDNANAHLDEAYKRAGLSISTSNLCTEIMLPTRADYSSVCCLSSVNALKYDEWKDDEDFVSDIVEFLDNVLDIYLKMEIPEAVRASILNERSIGIGLMGWHSLLQEKMVPFESAIAEGLNRSIWQKLRKEAYAASERLGEIRGVPQIYTEGHEGKKRRNVSLFAVAPTTSISIIAGQTSPGIEPLISNLFTHKTKIGTRIVRNKKLEQVLSTKVKEAEMEAVWKSIAEHGGSVQHLDMLTPYEKEVFKTAFEIDQMWILHHAAVRQEFIDQGQSVNLFIRADEHVLNLFKYHVYAWRKGLKSLYYLRSLAISKADVGTDKVREVVPELDEGTECLSCQ